MDKSDDFVVSEIQSERLVLRPISMGWKEDIFREFNDEITTYMFPSSPTHIAETEDFIGESIEKMGKGEEVVFVILKKDTSEFLGCAGLHLMHTDNPELGVWLKRSAHGNKYGFEAISAITKWAERCLNGDCVLYPVDKNNIPSRKIAERLGGTVKREYDQSTASGKILQLIEYIIPLH